MRAQFLQQPAALSEPAVIGSPRGPRDPKRPFPALWRRLKPDGVAVFALLAVLTALAVPLPAAAQTWSTTITVGNYYSDYTYDWVDHEYSETVVESSERERGYRRQYCVAQLGDTDAETPQARSRGDTCYGSIGSGSFTVDGTTYEIEGIYYYTAYGALVLDFKSEVDVAALGNRAFLIGGHEYRLSDRIGRTRTRQSQLTWLASSANNLEWAVGDTIPVSLSDQLTSSVPRDRAASKGQSRARSTTEAVPLTARFTKAPTSHNGTGDFKLVLEFSHEPRGYSYRTVRDRLFEVDGGRIVRAKRVVTGRNQQWRLTVVPEGTAPVTLTAQATTDCAAQYATCDSDGRMFAGNLNLTVPGPELVLPSVSIAPTATPTTEGAAVAFTLTRTGDASAELIVSVGVTESGNMLDGTPPATVTFAAGASTTQLSLATVDDAVHEADARVQATIVSGESYTVDDTNASAGVDVFDNDSAPVSAGPSSVDVWSTTMAWSYLGHGDYGGWAAAFEQPEWTENGRTYRIWWIAYDSHTRTLTAVHDGRGGHIDAPGELTLHIGHIAIKPGGELTKFARAGLADVTDIDLPWQAGEQVTVRLTRTVRAAGSVPPADNGPSVTVADAQVSEASGAPLRFQVTLNAPAEETVSLRYRTSDGTAHAGADYVASHGAVRFAPGELSKTVEVPVLADSHDEGSETMTLTLFGPRGVRIADATATGTISNSGPIPNAWIARFGRTVADQVIDAVQQRIRTARQPGAEVRLGGKPIDLRSLFGEEPGGDRTSRVGWRREAEGLDRALGLADSLRGETGHGVISRVGVGTTHQRRGSRTMGPRELLLGSSFSATAETADNGFISLWGRGAVTRFDGREGELSLDGQAVSAMLGGDYSRGSWTTGLMLAHSRGEGGYRDGAEGGTIEATLTGLYPWLRRTLGDRMEAWGVAGYGLGGFTLTPGDGPAMQTDLDMWMAAAGLRGTIVDGGGEGLTLTGKTDAMIVRISTDSVSGVGGRLAAAVADVTRLRLGLEGTLPVHLEDGSVLTPGFEVGVRQDSGDAETGFGADIGASLAWADRKRGLSAELRGRGLLTHAAKGFRELGLSASLAWKPEAGGRGPQLGLTQTLGGASSGGADALLSGVPLEGLAANGNGGNLGNSQLSARFGYGFAAFGDRYTWTPELGFGLSNSGREYSLGWRLEEVDRGVGNAGGSLALSFEAKRRETADGSESPEHALAATLSARY